MWLSEEEQSFAPPIHSQLSALTTAHHSLQQLLAESVTSLGIQLNILQTQQEPKQDENLKRVEELVTEITQVRAAFGSRLVSEQISVEKAQERKQVIHHCEERIKQLRSVVSNKEGDINFLEVELGRDSLPRKENMNILNTVSAQNNSIRKYTQDNKRLSVQISALQHVLSSKNLPLPPQQTCKPYISTRSNDILLSRVLLILSQEQKNQQSLLCEFEQLKTEFRDVNKQVEQGAQKYRKMTLKKGRDEEKDQPFLGEWLTNMETPQKKQPQKAKSKPKKWFNLREKGRKSKEN